MPEALVIKVLYFAALREACGRAEEDWPVTGALAVTELLKELTRRHPTLAPRLSSIRVAINEEFATPDARVQPGSVVALLPPVAGG